MQQTGVSDELQQRLSLLAQEQLSSVTFVLDYWTLDFNGERFVVMSRIEVSGVGWAIRDGDDQFRNRLCERIGSGVITATASTNDIEFAMADGCVIRISLRAKDYVGPEAVVFSSRRYPNDMVI